MTIRTRIAPSPTGQLHIGSLATALRNYAYAKKSNGRFIIRIEDTDRERLVKNAAETTLQTLKEYGLSWDEGPDKSGPFGPYTQSQRLGLYQQYARQLVDQHQAYYCFCTKERLAQMRADQQAKKQLPRYDRHCLNLSQQEISQKLAQHTSHVIRLKVPSDQIITFTDLVRGKISVNSNEIDDQVLLKSDGYPTYHLAVVVDDHLMKISHIIRGEEWISSTPKHILLFQAFNWQQPTYAHTPVFLSPTGKGKMSKRHGDVSARSFLDKGYLPEAVLNFLMIMGWAPIDKNEIISLNRFVQEFDIQNISAKAVIFDLNKLKWLNGLYIRQLSDSQLLDRLQPFKPDYLDNTKLKLILPLIKERLELLSQLEDLTSFFVKEPSIDPKPILKESKVSIADTIAYLKQVEIALSSLSDWSVSSIEDALHELQQQIGWKPRPAFMTIRLAITGRPATPPLFDTLHLIGQQQSIKRLSHAQKILAQ